MGHGNVQSSLELMNLYVASIFFSVLGNTEDWSQDLANKSSSNKLEL